MARIEGTPGESGAEKAPNSAPASGAAKPLRSQGAPGANGAEGAPAGEARAGGTTASAGAESTMTDSQDGAARTAEGAPGESGAEKAPSSAPAKPLRSQGAPTSSAAKPLRSQSTPAKRSQGAPRANGARKAPSSNTPASGGARSQGAPGAGEESGGLKRNLTNRHIQLIALGGAIGTGLFYGSSSSIQLAGPSVIVAYAVGGLAIFLIVRALSEMSVEEPKAGAFSYYATRYWSRRAGFVSGWNYWFNYILVSMVELDVVGTFVAYWLPGVPLWVSSAVFLVAITAVNLLGVGKFGEFEFWLAIIKITAVVAMIVGGAAVVALGIGDASWGNLASRGGFLPHGLLTRQEDGTWTGLLMALVVVMFSFGGTELIGVTAGETADPGRTIPRAANGIIVRILVFYILSLTVIMAVMPWDTIDGTTSPFVQIFDSVGVHAAAGILNFVCLTAVVSVYNSGLYADSRMLYSLARQGNAPRFLGRLDRRGVPRAAVLVSAGVTAAAVVVVYLWPQFAFNYLMSVATIAAFINWTMVMVTQVKFRAHVRAGDGPGRLAGLTGEEAEKTIAFPLPFAHVTPWAVIAFLALIAGLMCLSAQYRTALVVGALWLGLLLACYPVAARRGGAIRQMRQ